jgi:hypothetical protein
MEPEERESFEELMEKFAFIVMQGVPKNKEETEKFLKRMQNTGYASASEVEAYMKLFDSKGRLTE